MGIIVEIRVHILLTHNEIIKKLKNNTTPGADPEQRDYQYINNHDNMHRQVNTFEPIGNGHAMENESKP